MSQEAYVTNVSRCSFLPAFYDPGLRKRADLGDLSDIADLYPVVLTCTALFGSRSALLAYRARAQGWFDACNACKVCRTGNLRNCRLDAGHTPSGSDGVAKQNSHRRPLLWWACSAA